MQIHIQFSLNQIGLAIDYWHENEWRGLELLKLKQPCMAQAVMTSWINASKVKGFDISASKKGF